MPPPRCRIRKSTPPRRDRAPLLVGHGSGRMNALEDPTFSNDAPRLCGGAGRVAGGGGANGGDARLVRDLGEVVEEVLEPRRLTGGAARLALAFLLVLIFPFILTLLVALLLDLL
eukprot:2985838-Prymnesium_polylepis.1